MIFERLVLFALNKTYHAKYTSRQDIATALRHIKDSINGCGYNFMEDPEGRKNSIAFANSTKSDHSIIVLASFDFSYYHNLELVFMIPALLLLSLNVPGGITGRKISWN